MKQEKKRINLAVLPGLYKLIEKSAEFRNITVTRWLIQAIVMKLEFDKQYE